MSIFAFSAHTYDELIDVTRATLDEVSSGRRIAPAVLPHGPFRLAIVARDPAEREAGLRDALELLRGDPPDRQPLARGRVHFGRVTPEAPAAPTVCLFPGYGARPTTLARDLLRAYPVVERWLQAFGDRLSGSSTEGRRRQQEARRPVDHVLTADLAMWVLLREAGLSCAAVAGHSFGENAALIAAGLIDDHQAMVNVLARIDAASEAPPDPDARFGMLAVTAASRPILDPLLRAEPPRLFVALDNCPGQLVVWGRDEDLGDVERTLRDRGDVVFRLTDLGRPVHTPAFPLSFDSLRDLYGSVPIATPSTPVWSASTASPFPGDPSAVRDLLARQWVTPVRFRELIDAMYAAGVRTFVETGPGDRLSGFVRDTLRGRPGVTAIVTHAEGQPTMARLELALAQLFVRGHDIDFGRMEVDWSDPAAEAAGHPGAAPAAATRAAELLDLVAGETAALLGVSVEEVDVDRGFFDLGLESVSCVALAARLSERLGTDVPQTLPFDMPTVRRLAEALGRGRRTSARRSRAISPDDRAIAIVGMACRLPGGANTPAAYWDLLRDGRDAVGPAPPHRLGVGVLDTLDDPDVRARAGFGGFLEEDIRAFDARFFGIAPREAETLDPQQRLLLEVTWEALEHAGIDPRALGDTHAGVFVGISHSDYASRLSSDERLEIGGYIGLGNTASTAAGRLSFFLGLHGPCLAVDTACSSSLTAVHLACRSLIDGESTVAIAAGVNLLIGSETTILLSRARALSPTGKCRTFDDAADGYVRGEGCGVVVLKRLADARADGDRVLAVIRGGAIGHDGRTSGLSVPSGDTQEAVVREALDAAGCTPADVELIEAHGTGTPLGDPIELQALDRVFGAGPRTTRLALGSAKTNLGHLEAAAGIAGLIKVVLQWQHRWMAPSLHCETPTSRFEWRERPFDVVSTGRAWEPAPGAVAGISSFGISGTNVHLVVGPGEEAPAAHEPEAPCLLVLSAPNDAALHQIAGDLADRLAAERPPLARVARTLMLGRATFGRRRAMLASDLDRTIDRLRAVAASDASPAASRPSAAPLRIAFVFSGEPGDAAAASAALAARDASFREIAAEIERGISSTIARDRPDLRLFVFEVALASLWQRWGIVPGAVAGAGVGELAAACVAGMLPVESAARVLAAGDPAARRAALDQIALVPARWPVYDGHGERIDTRIAVPPAWGVLSLPDRAITSGLDALERGGYTLGLGIGPSPDLANVTRRAASALRRLPSVRSAATVREDLLRAAGDLFECGANPRWAAVIGDAAGPRADLPFYPFQREIYWIDAPQNREEKPSRVFAGAGIRRSQPADEGRVRFEARVSRRAVAAWFGAAGKGSRELPFSALMAIAVDAERQQRPEDAVALGGLRIDAPIALSLESRVVHTVVDDPGERRAIYTASETGEWTCHAAWRRGSVSMADCAVPRDVPDAARLGREEFYARARAAGLNVSSRFEVIDSVEIGREVLRGRLHLPDGAAEPIRTLMLAEGCAQLVQAASAAAGTLGSVTIGGVDALVIAPLAVQSLAVDVVWHTHAEELELTLTGRDEEGRPVVVLRGVRAHHARSSSESARVRLRDRLAAASDAEKPVFLSDYVRAAAAHVLGLRGDRGLDLDEPLSRQGLDSLMALQLSTAIAVELDVRLPVTQIVDRSVRSLLDDIGRALERPDGRDVPAVPSAFVHGEL